MRVVALLAAVAVALPACGGGGGAATLSVSFQGPLTAGEAVTLTVRAPEGFAGAVICESTDPRAVLPARYTWTAADGTSRAFPFEFRTAGSHTLTLRGTGLFSFVTAVDVVAGPHATFLFQLGGVQPGADGAPFGMGASVIATDAWGNAVPFDASIDPVTITSSPADGTYGGLGGAGGNLLDQASDFQGSDASLDGRFVFTWNGGADPEHRFVATSQSGRSGTSDPVRIVTGVGVSGIARFLDTNRNSRVDGGDQLIVPFERDVTVQPGSAQAFEFLLPGHTVGSGATMAAGPRPHEVRVVLGAGAQLRTRKLTAGPFPSTPTGVDLAAGTAHVGIRDVFGLPGRAGTPVEIVPGFVLSPQLIGNADTRAVACGDIDRDGDIDLVCANRGSASCVYRNDGKGNFALAASLPAVNAARAVALRDVDGDSDLDAVFGGTGPDLVYLNDGGGTFLDSAQRLGNEETRRMLAADVDGDGDTDLVTASDAAIRIWFNDGAGAFQASSQSLPHAPGAAVAIGDLNRDGRIDILSGAGGVAFWANAGSGVFVRLAGGLGSDSTALALGDVDGDGDLDAVAAAGTAIVVWANDGNGSFGFRGNLPLDAPARCVSLSDIDRNGYLDVLTGGAVWVNDGTGSFVPSGIDFAECSDAPDVAVADLDLDGDEDLVFAQSSANRVYTASLSGSCGAGGEIAFDAVDVNSSSLVVAVADFDRDGDLDILGCSGDIKALYGYFLPAKYEHNYMLLNRGNGTFEQREVFDRLDVISIAVGDIDRDGTVDAVLGSPFGVSVWLGDGKGDFSQTSPFGLDFEGAKGLALADVDQDGDLDLVASTDYGAILYRNRGDGMFLDGRTVITSLPTRRTAVADLDRDGDLDIVTAHTNAPNRVFRNDGQSVFTDIGQRIGSYATSDIVLGDMDRDGDLDLVEGNYFQPNRIYFNDGTGRFTDSGQALGNQCTNAVAVLDVDCDGDLDVVEGNASTWDRIWRNNGAGDVSEAYHFNEGSTFAYGVGDFDRDGDADFFVANFGLNNTGGPTPAAVRDDSIYFPR